MPLSGDYLSFLPAACQASSKRIKHSNATAMFGSPIETTSTTDDDFVTVYVGATP
jgi:hypothetical protein